LVQFNLGAKLLAPGSRGPFLDGILSMKTNFQPASLLYAALVAFIVGLGLLPGGVILTGFGVWPLCFWTLSEAEWCHRVGYVSGPRGNFVRNAYLLKLAEGTDHIIHIDLPFGEHPPRILVRYPGTYPPLLPDTATSAYTWLAIGLPIMMVACLVSLDSGYGVARLWGPRHKALKEMIAPRRRAGPP
jgi:hypothetical protein